MTQLNEKTVQESMDAHSKRMACAFAKWLSFNKYQCSMDGYMWMHRKEGVLGETFTTEQLYDKFIQSL